MRGAARVIPRLSLRVWLCFSATALAQAPGPEFRAGGQLYLHSIGLPKEAQVCERHIPGYRTLFDPLYTSWKERHQELMARAQEFMKEAARKEGKPFEPIVAEVTDNAAATLAGAPEDLIWESCLFRLLALRKTTSPGAGSWPLEDYRAK
jgi:hypothetical protein